MITCGQGCTPECGFCVYFTGATTFWKKYLTSDGAKREEKWCTLKEEAVEVVYVCDRFYCKFKYQKEGWI